MSQERREYQRVPCALPGDFISSDERYGQAILSDISIAGAQFRTNTALAQNSQLEINVISKKMENITLEGRVCWCHKENDSWRVGIDFNMPFLTPFDEIM